MLANSSNKYVLSPQEVPDITSSVLKKYWTQVRRQSYLGHLCHPISGLNELHASPPYSGCNAFPYTAVSGLQIRVTK